MTRIAGNRLLGIVLEYREVFLAEPGGGMPASVKRSYIQGDEIRARLQCRHLRPDHGLRLADEAADRDDERKREAGASSTG